MSVKLYTPATGFPDLELKIAYGIARIGLEAFGERKSEIFTIRDLGGYYEIEFFIDEEEFEVVNKTLNFVLRRIFSSFYIQDKTPGVTGNSEDTFKVTESGVYLRDIYKNITHKWNKKSSEKLCSHGGKSCVYSVVRL